LGYYPISSRYPQHQVVILHQILYYVVREDNSQYLSRSDIIPLYLVFLLFLQY
jgi:hypothetical protein